MTTRPDSMGIYADYQKKRQEKYDVKLEVEVREWIEAVLGRKLEGATFRESLMDGTVVCELVNRLVPGTIKKIHKSPLVLFRRENFGFFQNACVKLGCKESETAVFEDVYDDRNMGLFLVNIMALARNVQYKPGYNGPILASARPPASGQKQNFTPEQLAKGYTAKTAQQEAVEVSGNAMDASRYFEHGIVNNPDENKFHGNKH